MDTVKKERKKAGRPVKTVRKERRLAVRFSAAEYFIMQEKARQAGLKPSAYLRQAAIYAGIRSRLSPEEKEIARQLIGMANNLNQVAKVCHTEGLLPALVYFENYRNRIDELLNRLKP